MLGGNMEMGMTNNITRKPTVFVSSTCYDLNSVRKEIKDFFEQQLGYETILSEYMEFPISPERDTFENCVDNVDTKADIFILIVGTRYGYVVEDKNKSITNIEYLHAKAKGIPIYIFIHKSIIETLPKWENEPNTDFSGIVDNTSLFEFVQQIRSEDNKWTFEFECVENIVESLRVQIANLLSDSLVLRMHKYENGISKKVMSYFGEVFEMAVEKPRLWEFRLFAAVLKENMKRTEDLQLDLKYGISFDKVYIVKDLKESMEWILAKVFELKNYISMIEPLINDALTMALGVPGESGNEEYIIYVAEKVVEVYKSLLKWSLEFKTVVVPEECSELVKKVSIISIPMVEKIGKDINDYNQQLQEQIILPTTEKREFKFIFDICPPDMAEVYQDIEQFSRKLGVYFDMV